MNVPTDEAGALQVALLRGQWRRLTDPLLEAMLLTCPDRWVNMERNCALELGIHALQGASVAFEDILDWLEPFCRPLAMEAARVVVQFSPRENLTTARVVSAALSFPYTNQHNLACLTLARRAVAIQPTPDTQAALAVLNRWATSS